MKGERYTIRYRRGGHPEQTALVIEDETGTAYLYERAGLHCRLTRAHSLARLEDTLHRLGWYRVPAVPPYTLDQLRRLLIPAGHDDPAPPRRPVSPLVPPPPTRPPAARR